MSTEDIKNSPARGVPEIAQSTCACDECIYVIFKEIAYESWRPKMVTSLTPVAWLIKIFNCVVFIAENMSMVYVCERFVINTELHNIIDIYLLSIIYGLWIIVETLFPIVYYGLFSWMYYNSLINMRRKSYTIDIYSQ